MLQVLYYSLYSATVCIPRFHPEWRNKQFDGVAFRELFIYLFIHFYPPAFVEK